MRAEQTGDVLVELNMLAWEKKRMDEQNTETHTENVHPESEKGGVWSDLIERCVILAFFYLKVLLRFNANPFQRI